MSADLAPRATRSPARRGLALAGAVIALLQASPETMQRHVDGVWAVDLPTDWRRLAREEAVDVSGLPFDTPAEVFRNGDLTLFGAVDRWRVSGFAGGGLAVMASKPEQTIDETFAVDLRQRYETPRSAAGERRVIDHLELGKIGKDGHSAVLMEVHGEDATGKVVFRSIDVSTGTSGQLLILSFRAWENEWKELEPKLRAMASSLTFARPPRQKGQLSDALLQAAVIGGILVVTLFVLRSFLKRRPPEHQLPSAREGGSESGSPPPT